MPTLLLAAPIEVNEVVPEDTTVYLVSTTQYPPDTVSEYTTSPYLDGVAKLEAF